MAKFVFKLEALLRQRKREEQQCQRRLAEHAAIVNAAEDAVRRINDSVQAGHEDVRRHLKGRLDMSFLTAHRRFMLSMQRQATDLVQKVVIAKKQLEDARLKLAEAAQRRKAIEKLREKQLVRWQLDQARRETALSDEIGSQIAYHNMTVEDLAEDFKEAIE